MSLSERRSTVKKASRKKENSDRSRNFSVYKVKSGDTLYRIGRLFNLEPSEIRSVNKLTENDSIFVGMKLKIPGKEKTCSAVKERSYRDESVTGPTRGGEFIWPVKNVVSVKRDGDANVKSIGVIITADSSCVRASSSGVVEKVGRMRGFGNFIVIRHSGGMVSVYSGLDSINVREGDAVPGGSEIGVLGGEKGNLHFMLHHSGKPEDPLKILPSRRS